MKWPEVGGVLAKLAPAIASAAGGPLAGTAVSALESVFGLKGEGDLPKRQDGVAAAIAGASPDQLLELKKADDDFQARMTELGFADAQALAKLGNEDRDSARKREMSVRDWTPRALTIAVFASFLGLIVYSRWMPDNRLDLSKEGLTALRDAVIMVVSYYFGSSSESSKKTDLLAKS